MPRGASHWGRSGAGGSLYHARCGGVHFHGDPGGPGFHDVVFLPGRRAVSAKPNLEAVDPRDFPPDGPMISLRNLRVAYSGREILHGVNFDVQRGETLVILGGSGSGKSTLLRTLVGLEMPTSGEVWMRGKNFVTISNDERD